MANIKRGFDLEARALKLGLDEKAIETTRYRLQYLHCEYSYFLKCDSREISSAGTTASYSLVNSGKTNRCSDFTASHAIRLANLSPQKIASLRWIDCAWRVFVKGTAPVLNMNHYTVTERRVLDATSYVLYYKAFLGYTFERIAVLGLPSRRAVSRQRVHEFWQRAILEVALEARKEGLV